MPSRRLVTAVRVDRKSTRLPTNQCPHIHGLESKQMKGRISTAAPRILAYPLQSLRPILHITCPDSMISYSKGSRGLFVPSRVIGIFTDTTISLSSRLRQRPDHYTIRAGSEIPCRVSSDLHEWCNDLDTVSTVSSVKL